MDSLGERDLVHDDSDRNGGVVLWNQMNLISELWASARKKKRIARACTSAQARGWMRCSSCAGLGIDAIHIRFLGLRRGESILHVMAFAFDGVVCPPIWCLFR